MTGPPGPDALRRRRLKAEREREHKREVVRRHGADAGELEPCAWCGEGHPPGFCSDPAEHEVVCASRARRCPRACIAVCLLSLQCPDCHAKDGAWCVRPSGHKAMDIHEQRYRAADRIAIEQAPEQVLLALGEEGLRLWRRLLGMDGPRTAHPGAGRICPVAHVRCEALACVNVGCTAAAGSAAQQVIDFM